MRNQPKTLKTDLSSLHPNLHYILREAEKISASRNYLLDLGCGKGDLVVAASKKGWRAFGLEHFSHGSGTNIRETLKDRGLLGSNVFEYDGAAFPFKDNSFDIVVSNMVFEHVPDLEPILAEISRVLRPDGKFICLFPTMDCFREGHAEVPFAHWFPRSRLRVIWLLLFRYLGFGRLKGNKTRIRWAIWFNEWLEQNVFYISERQLLNKMKHYFSGLHRAEVSYIDFRLSLLSNQKIKLLLNKYFPASLKAWFCKEMGPIVIICFAPRRNTPDSGLTLDSSDLTGR